MNLAHPVDILDSTSERHYLDSRGKKDGTKWARDARRTMRNRLMRGYRRMKSSTLPLRNQGTATAGIGSVTDAKGQQGMMFG